MKSDSVTAVVVTYNRKSDLINCLKTLANHSKFLKKIIIIDNNSTDGTRYALREIGFSQDENSYETITLSSTLGSLEIEYYRLERNTGGAGGFNYGQTKALDSASDWVWLMDDDGVPEDGCLDRLLATAETTNYKVINPLVINVDDRENLSFDLNGSKTVNQAISMSTDGIVDNSITPFNGTLLNRRVIEKVGTIKQNMFIWGDEQEYLLRLKKFKVQLATDTRAHFYHPPGKTIYERFLGKHYIAVKPSHLEMNYYRNMGYIDRVYNGGIKFKYLFIYVLFFLSKSDIKRTYNFLRYYFDGYTDKYKLKNIL